MIDREPVTDHESGPVRNKASNIEGTILQVGSAKGNVTVNLPTQAADSSDAATPTPEVAGSLRPNPRRALTIRVLTTVGAAIAGMMIWQLVSTGIAPHSDARPDSPLISSSPSTTDLSSPAPTSPTAPAQPPRSSPSKPQRTQSTQPDTPPRILFSPGSNVRIRNVSTAQCVSGGGSNSYAGFGPCSTSDEYTWTVLAAGGETFELINRASGKCLSAFNMNFSFNAGLATCGQSNAFGPNTVWLIDKSTSTGRTLKNVAASSCLTIESAPYGGGRNVATTACNSDQPQQLWTNAD